MKFREWIFFEQSMPLPPIPNGWQRLTHFTNPQIAQKLIQGQDFQAPKGLASTTDPFSDNDQVWQTIQTGEYGAFTRNSFGTAVVLMDMSPLEYRIRANPASGEGNVPNDRIVGYYDLTSQQFIANPNYSTNQTPPQIPQQNMRGGNATPQPVPQATTTTASEIW